MDSNNKPLILIVEDVESNYLYLNAVLAKLDVKVEWAKNGIEAVDFAKATQTPTLSLWIFRCPK